MSNWKRDKTKEAAKHFACLADRSISASLLVLVAASIVE